MLAEVAGDEAPLAVSCTTVTGAELAARAPRKYDDAALEKLRKQVGLLTADAVAAATGLGSPSKTTSSAATSPKDELGSAERGVSSLVEQYEASGEAACSAVLARPGANTG